MQRLKSIVLNLRELLRYIFVPVGHPELQVLKSPAGAYHGKKRYYVPNHLAPRDLKKMVKRWVWIPCSCGHTMLLPEDAKQYCCLVDCCYDHLLRNGQIDPCFAGVRILPGSSIEVDYTGWNKVEVEECAVSESSPAGRPE